MIISYFHISDCNYVHISKAILDLPQIKIEHHQQKLGYHLEFVYFCPLNMGV